ncbi:MAG TPA: leucyl aminopeptidase [candidate division Zixibacteria bacterium]
MKVELKSGRMEELKAEALALGIFEGQGLSKEVKVLDKKLEGAISQLLKSGDFTAKLNQTAVLYPKSFITRRVILAGLGKKEKFELDKIRQAAGTVYKKVKELKIKNYVSYLYGRGQKGIDFQASAQALTVGTLLSSYHLDQYKTEGKEELFEVESMTIFEEDKTKKNVIEKGMKTGEISSWGTNLARNMVDHPGNVMTPGKMAEIALNLSKEYKFRCEVLSPADLEKLKFGALLAVAQGSQQPAKFIVMEHMPEKKRKGTIVLVGKAITFDSGGISIKPSEGMWEMKGDMAGGAAVIATMACAAREGIPVHLIGLVPATENLPSGTAYKPGDIIKSYSGKTIEIISTDAEGRLILADALAYAQKYEPKAILDIATLTGACVVALGNVVAGLLGNDQRLLNKVKRSAEKTGEKVWELPLYEEYDEQIKSDLADMKNSGGRPAGTITAAAFLKKFVGKTPWAHLDIAGRDWEEKSKPYIPKGPVGFGVRLFLEFLRNWDKR